jgi:ABC-type glycerol-3-phosphate transport system substrate-binding protein
LISIVVCSICINAAELNSLDAWAKEVKKNCKGSTITLAFATHTSTDAFQKMTPEFEKLTGIKVNWDVMETNYLKNKQLIDHTGNSSRYDVFMVDGFWMDEYGSKKVIIPLEDYLNNPSLTPEWFDFEDIVPAYRNGIAKYQGKVYGVPTAGETRFLGYRTDLFKKYKKEPPKTLDELVELARFFNGKEPNLYGIALRGQRGIMFASGWMSILYNFGGGFLDQETGKITMTDPSTVESLKCYLELLKNAPPDVGSYTHEEATSAFMTGRSAMWIDATAIVPWILDPEKSKVYDKVDFVPIPKGPEGKYGALAGWSMSIPTTSKNKDAAWAFIVFMTSKLKAKEYILNEGVPTRTSVYTNPELIVRDFSYPAQLESLEDANRLVEKGILWIPAHEKLGQILDRVGYYGSVAFTGKLAPEKVCKDAQKELEEIVND